NLRYNSHIEIIVNKATKACAMVNATLPCRLKMTAARYIYTQYIRPVMEFGAPVLVNLPLYLRNRIDALDRMLMKKCIGIPQSTKNEAVYALTNLGPITQRFQQLSARGFVKLRNNANR